MKISQMIAKLRRERGMTQENLAEEIGVSSQTISKWETATTLPDVTLLPLLADVFGVTIDAMYGREHQARCLSPNEAIEYAVDGTRRAIVSAIWDAKLRPFSEELADYELAMQDETHRSMIQGDRDMLYFREKRGALALRCPESGWYTLFEDEKAAELLILLADRDFRKAMSAVLTRRMQAFTLPTLMRAANLSDGAHLEECLNSSGLFIRKEVQVDDAPLVFWEMWNGKPQQMLMYAVLAFAQEAASYNPHHYCFFGSNDCALS